MVSGHSPESNPESGYEDKGHGPAIPEPFLYPFFCLGCGLVFDALFSQSMATVCLLTVSFGLTMIGNVCLGGDQVEAFLNQYTWAKMDPHTIMFALLPTLIFESAFALDAHHFKRFAGQLLTFAGPAFVLALLTMGSLMHIMMWIVGENQMWRFGFCMMYGAIVSATDPVAVVALLKSLGVPHHLKVLIEGESLFNDGAAIFLHSLIHTILQFQFGVGGKISLPWEISIRLLGVCGSVVIGHMFARIAGLVLGNLFDSIRERAVVMIFVYASYATAELIKGSGVLCLVVFGISLNARRQWISAEAYIDNKQMWGFLAYFANCIIFITTGLLAARDLYKTDGRHYALGLLAYLFSVLSRAGAIIVFVGTVIRRFGPYPPQYSPIVIWGGLRGALALLLALTAKNDPLITELEQIGQQGHTVIENQLYSTMLAFISITVVLSNLIQGVTSGPLTQKLGLCAMSFFQFEHLKEMKKRLNEFVKQLIEKKKTDPFYDFVNWRYVSRRTEVHLHLEVEQAKHDTEDEEDVEEEARENVERCYEAQLWHLWNSGFISVDVRALHGAITEAATSHGAMDIEYLYDRLKPSKLRRRLGMCCLKMKKAVPNCFKWLVDKPQVQDIWYMLAGVIACIQAALSIYIFVKSYHTAIDQLKIFLNSLLVLFLALEPLFRLWTNRRALRKTYLKKSSAWPWVDLLSVALYAIVFGVYMAIFQKCNQGDLLYFKHSPCTQLQIATLFSAVSLLIKLPQVLYLMVRFVVEVEITGVLQRKDEESLEGLTAVINMTETVKRRLDSGMLVRDPDLRKKLSDECDLVTKNAKRKLDAVMKKVDAKPLMTTIKTRQVCRELLSDMKRELKKLEEDGDLGENEVEHLGTAITMNERRVRGLHRLIQKQLESERSEMEKKLKKNK